jgi:hypothetical protein
VTLEFKAETSADIGEAVVARSQIPILWSRKAETLTFGVS